MDKDFDDAANPPKEPDKGKEWTEKDKPAPTYDLPAPGLGGGSTIAPMRPKTRPAPTHTREEIREWAIDQATLLKTAHAAESHEREAQHETAFKSMIEQRQAMMERQEALEADHAQTQAMIAERQNRSLTAKLFYKISGHEEADRLELQEKAQSLEQCLRENDEDLQALAERQTELDTEMMRFKERCEDQTQDLNRTIQQAYKDQRIPGDEHTPNPTHTHDRDGGHER